MPGASLPIPAPAGPSRSSRSLPVAGPAHPSYPLVASHFAVGFAWALVAGASLVALAPTLAQGGFLDPRVLGTTHLITLGFLTTVITGVLYQLFPAMLGIGERSRRVAWLSLGLQAVGTALLASGLVGGARQLQGAGWLVLFGAVFGTAWNLLPQRRRAPRNRQLGIYVSYAHMGFGFAMAVAAARIGDAFGWWVTPRLGLISAHFHLAVAGFVLMTAVGVGSRMLPMFYGTATPLPPWADRWLPRILAVGALAYAAGAIVASVLLAWAGAVVLAAGALLFLWFGWGWFARRARRALDPATALLTLSLAALGAAVPLGLMALAAGLRRPGVLIAYAVLLLLGFGTMLVLGVSYRVLPTLTWHHRFAAQASRPGTPPLPALLAPRLGWAAAAAASTGLPCFTVGLLAQAAVPARAGAALLTLALALTAGHHLRMLLIHRGASPALKGTP